jgi:ABC-2 type transport system ATP-binding protein
MANPAMLAVHHACLLPLTVRRSGLRPSGFRPNGNRLTVPPMSPPPGNAIEVHGLTKRYGDVLAVDRIDFAAPSGATLGLLGGNGAGKTTTIAMLLGLLLPTSGSIRVLGHDMLRDRFAALARMNFSSPYVSLPQRLTVRENLRVYGHL